MAALRASDYVRLIEHALGGPLDERLDPMIVVNQALSYLINMHDWKFRKRPPLDVAFQAAAAPTVQAITAIARAANVVTVTVGTAPVPGFTVGHTALVSGVTDDTFDGSFTIVSVISELQATWAQVAANASSSGGTVGEFAYEQFLDLPADFGELLDVCTKNNAIANIIPTSLQEIAFRRGSPNAVAYDGLYRVAMSFPGQIDVETIQDVPRLEIWPRPTASNSNGDLTLTYRAGPIPLIYEADDDSSTEDTVPNFPPSFERLMTLLCRLFAQGYDEEVIQQDPLIQAEVSMLMEADGRQQFFMGMMKGGAYQRKQPYQLREFRSIGNPANRL